MPSNLTLAGSGKPVAKSLPSHATLDIERSSKKIILVLIIIVFLNNKIKNIHLFFLCTRVKVIPYFRYTFRETPKQKMWYEAFFEKGMAVDLMA